MTITHEAKPVSPGARVGVSSTIPGAETGQNVTPAQRAAAARIRVVANKKLGRPTARWIKELAKSA